MPEEKETIAAGTSIDGTAIPQNLPPVVETQKIPSIDELITKMELATKAQLEIMERKYQDQIGNLQKSIDEEKMKHMSEKEKEEHAKRLDAQRQIEKEQALIKQIQELEAEKTLARNSAFVQKTISEKPYLKEVVEKMKIQTPEEYDRYIKPMEETYKKHNEMQNYLKTNTNRDVFSGYDNGNSLFSNTSPTKDKEEVLKSKAKALLDSIF